MLKLQPDLSGNPFFAAGKALAKRLGTEGGNSCPKYLLNKI